MTASATLVTDRLLTVTDVRTCDKHIPEHATVATVDTEHSQVGNVKNMSTDVVVLVTKYLMFLAGNQVICISPNSAIDDR